MGTLVAAAKFLKEARFKAEFLFILVFLAALGAFTGAPPIAIFLAARRRFGLADTSARFSENALLARSAGIALIISFYDGMLGPGTGTFLALALTRLCGFDLLRSTALAKLLNLTSNAAALAAFLYLGRVDLKLGLAMGLAGMAGNYAGSHLALKKGAWVIRPMLLVICGSLLLKIVWNMLK